MTKRERYLGGITAGIVFLGLAMVLLSPSPARPGRAPAQAGKQPALPGPALPGAPSAQSMPASPAVTFETAMLRAVVASWNTSASTSYDDLTDPFTPLIGAGAAAQSNEPSSELTGQVRQEALLPILEGVFLAGKEQVALVDGRTVRRGDRVGGLTVHDIRQEGVVLTSGTRRLFLGFGKMEELR